jgi:putative oxidoreductase
MQTLNALAPYAHWLLRFAILSVFLYHGIDKFPKLAGMAEMMEMPVAMILMLAMMETVGSILVFIGGFLKDWMTRLGALLLMPVMVGAIAMVHWGQWHFMATETHPMGGMQFQITLLLVLLYFFIKGNKVNTGIVPQ